jgi:DNA-binding transcriptional regulator YiaG
MNTSPSRFSQAQILIAALFAVVFTGNMPENFSPQLKDPIGPMSEPKEDKPQATKRRFREPNPLYGICADVARKLHLSHEHVRQVSLGMRTSEVVLQALDAEKNLRSNNSRHGGDPEIGSRLRALRRGMKCKQGEFAQVLGVSQGIVSQWECARYMPSRIALLAIAHIAGSDSAWWFERAERTAEGRR